MSIGASGHTSASGIYDELNAAADRFDLNSVEATAFVGTAASAAAALISGAVLARVWLGGGAAAGPAAAAGSPRALALASRFVRLALAALIVLAQLMYSRLVVGKGINVDAIVRGEEVRPVEWENPFLHFQWDALLLEASVLAPLMLVFELLEPVGAAVARGGRATAANLLGAVGGEVGSWDSPAVHVLRFLLVKLMFQSGAVKILSGCPTWRGARARRIGEGRTPSRGCLPPQPWQSSRRASINQCA